MNDERRPSCPDRASSLGAAALATLLATCSGIFLLAVGLVDDSPAINRAIPLVGTAAGVVVHHWHRSRAEQH